MYHCIASGETAAFRSLILAGAPIEMQRQMKIEKLKKDVKAAKEKLK